MRWRNLFRGTQTARAAFCTSIASISGRMSEGERTRYSRNRDYFMVGECVRCLFTSCEGSLNERVSAANE